MTKREKQQERRKIEQYINKLRRSSSTIGLLASEVLWYKFEIELVALLKRTECSDICFRLSSDLFC